MDWIRFGHPHFLYLLWVTPAFILLYIYAFRQKRKAYQRFSSHHFFQRLTESVHFRRQKAKVILMTLSYTFLVLALSRPQIGTSLELVKRSGLDIMIGLDISASMLAEDIKPNRLLKAKHAISSFIDRLEGDRVGLIAFAGDSFVQCPLTIDYTAAKLLLDALSVDTISQSGTEISQAIEVAASSFNQEEDKYKVLLFLTDGEDHGKRAIEGSKSRSQPRHTHLLCWCRLTQSGNTNSAPWGGWRTPRVQAGSKWYAYRDEARRCAATEIAQLTNGNYYQATPGEAEINRLFAELAAIEKREIEERQFTQYEDRFQYFLAFALLFLVWDFLLPESRSNKPTANREEI